MFVGMRPRPKPSGHDWMSLTGQLCASVLVGVGCAQADEPQCPCSSHRKIGVWCNACNVGHIAAVKIESKPLFDAVDAHGHETRVEFLRCAECRKLAKSGGFCESCRTGYVAGKAYFSKLTYLLARGSIANSASVTCKKCRQHMRHFGWCDVCKVGMIGQLTFRDKELFVKVLKARDVLLQAVQHVDDCLSCAIAIAVDRSCRRCKKSYTGGRTIQPATGKGR